jgi:hypothetical protein
MPQPFAARTLTLALALASLLLAGCDQLGIATPAVTAARHEADAKAVGGACRHAGRAIEDCYTLNKTAEKAAVYTGWREMNDYMRENNIEPVAPAIKPEPPPAPPPAKTKSADDPDHEGDEEDEEEADEAPPAKPSQSGGRSARP